jgi:hypothetical protein
MDGEHMFPICGPGLGYQPMPGPSGFSLHYLPFAQQIFLKVTLFWECPDPQAFTLNYLPFVQQIFSQQVDVAKGRGLHVRSNLSTGKFKMF